VPGDLAGVGAAGALARADRAVCLDVARVEVERHRLPLEQAVHASEEVVERAVELAEVPERETTQEAPERRRLGQGVAPQLLLGRVGAQQGDVLEAVAAGDQRLAEREDHLGRRIAARALLDRDPIEQLRQPEPVGELAHEHETGVGCDLLTRGGDLDQRRPSC